MTEALSQDTALQIIVILHVEDFFSAYLLCIAALLHIWNYLELKKKFDGLGSVEELIMFVLFRMFWYCSILRQSFLFTYIQTKLHIKAMWFFKNFPPPVYSHKSTQSLMGVLKQNLLKVSFSVLVLKNKQQKPNIISLDNIYYVPVPILFSSRCSSYRYAFLKLGHVKTQNFSFWRQLWWSLKTSLKQRNQKLHFELNFCLKESHS